MIIVEHTVLQPILSGHVQSTAASHREKSVQVQYAIIYCSEPDDMGVSVPVNSVCDPASAHTPTPRSCTLGLRYTAEMRHLTVDTLLRKVPPLSWAERLVRDRHGKLPAVFPGTASTDTLGTSDAPNLDGLAVLYLGGTWSLLGRWLNLH